MHKKFPFLSFRQTITGLRLATAMIFFLHAIVRIFNGTIPRFGAFLAAKGLPFSEGLVWGITVFEIAGSILLLLNYFTRVLAAGFIILLLVGIVLIHAQKGWFVGEHGSGGIEYSFILIMSLLVIAATDRKGSDQ